MAAALSLMNLFAALTLPSKGGQVANLVHYNEVKDHINQNAVHDSNIIFSQPEDQNEDQQTIGIQGSLCLIWKDARLAWNLEEFNNVTFVQFDEQDIIRFWIPTLAFTNTVRPYNEIMNKWSTNYQIRYDGLVTARVVVSLQILCNFGYTHYPRDTQTCYTKMYSPRKSSENIVFAQESVGTLHKSLRRDEMTNAVKVDTSFTITSMKTISSISEEAKNLTARTVVAKKFRQAFVQYIITIERTGNHFYTYVMIPLFCVSIASMLSFQIESTRKSVVSILLCLLLQDGIYNNMMGDLPGDVNVTPRCFRVAEFVMAESFILIVLRLILGHLENNVLNNRTTIFHDLEVTTFGQEE
uniref:Neur_chan_LBD domain-containing protein n=1 Tax=Rhabditophanes sp. KR3021 TaxID=114890 RepID=A0AC35U725_9BILA